MTATPAQLSLAILGTRVEGRPTVVEADRVRAYAAATNDPTPAARAGEAVPPLFAVVPAWDVLMGAVTRLVPADALPRLLHGEHDLHVLRPLAVGDRLQSTAEAHSIRVASTGTRLTVRVVSVGAGGEALVEQYATMFLRGLRAEGDGGPDKPDHTFPEAARQHPLGEAVRPVDADQTARYAAASGDHNPIHLDEAAARAVRLPGIVLHGLCTMAMCASAVVERAAAGDPQRLRRVAVRFSWPVFPGHDLTCSLYRAGEGDPGAYAFEATSRDKVVVRDGWAEVAAGS